MTEAHAAVSFAAPDEPFYLPGGQYEGLQLFIDPDAVQADSFLTVMGLEIGGIADYFCRDGVHCCPLSEAIIDILDEQWSDAEYATPGELRYTAVRLLYELLRLPDDAEAARCPARQVELVRETETLVLRDLSVRHTAKALADGFGLSESGFKLYCQNVLGEGYLAYFRRRRLEKAAELLRTTTLRVQDIAAGVGYESQGKFAKAFYDQFRLMPMEYRRLAK